MADDGESEPGPPGRAAARPVDAVEPLEDPLEVRRGDADPVVLHADDRPPVLDPRAEDDRSPTRFRVLHRVVEQVRDRGDHLPRVAAHERVRIDLLRLERDAVRERHRPEPVGRLVEQDVDRHVSRESATPAPR